MPPEAERDAPEIRPRPFWSGTITFGLVSIPVDLYPANRSRRVALRMLSTDGTPLSRRYYCPRTDDEVDYEHIVRGYEIETGKFVPVTDEELEALEPQKSREIDLRQFVPVDEIDPIFFQRGYFFAPTEVSGKAYRLLAETMERTGRAGIATFVMRGKEYLVAILAADGILRAETLRFQDEVRSPEELELPDLTKPDTRTQSVIERAIKMRTAKALAVKELEDQQSERIRSLAERKRRRRKDIVTAPEELVEAAPEGEIVDLMEVLKERMAAAPETKADARAAEPRKARSRKKAAATETLASRSKDDLYARAQELGIPGRSGMNKDELIRAIRQAERRAA